MSDKTAVRSHGDKADMAEIFAALRVGQMHLYHRNRDRFDRIMERDGAVCISAGIEQNRLCPGKMRFVQPIDQLPFMIRLMAGEPHAEAVGLGGEPCIDVVKRLRTINFGLTRSQQVEVGAVEDIDERKVGQGTGFRLRRCSHLLYGLHGKRQCEARQLVISIMLNGEQRQVRPGSIAALVASIGLDPKKVAVERNREIVPRSTLADVALAEGDALEIVHFVGGG